MQQKQKKYNNVTQHKKRRTQHTNKIRAHTHTETTKRKQQRKCKNDSARKPEIQTKLL